MHRSESDLRSCKVTKKAQKKFWGSNRIRTHDLRDTDAMLYLLLDASILHPQFTHMIFII